MSCEQSNTGQKCYRIIRLSIDVANKMKTKEQRLHDHEEHLLTNERSIRRSRAGAIGFIMLFFLISIVYSMGEPTSNLREDQLALSLNGCILLCIVLAYQYGMQIKHIDSIKRYRKKLSELREERSSQPQIAP